MSLVAVPVSFRDACLFVAMHHRHHPPPQGWKFGIAAQKDGVTVGVVCVGRPVNRVLDDGMTLEATRLATDGTRNACSFLYATAWRAAKSLGYRRMVTYIQPEEGGASLRASGWKLVAKTKGHSWNTPGRLRFEVALEGKP